VIGQWFHLYLILDLYSRKIVGWEVHDSDDSIHAAHLVRRTTLAEGIATLPTKPVLHGARRIDSTGMLLALTCCLT
jgi:putative transposase